MRAPLVHGRFLRKPQKTPEKGDFWVSKSPIVGLALLYFRGRAYNVIYLGFEYGIGLHLQNLTKIVKILFFSYVKYP